MNDKLPPKWAVNLLKKMLDPFLFNGIYGDLLERYHEIYQQNGKINASWYFIWNTLGFIRYWRLFKKRKLHFSNSISPGMIKNYLKTIFRSFLKRKAYVFLNIAGLSIGIASFILIWQYVNYEKSFDQFHEHSDRIYRLTRKDKSIGKEMANTKPDLLDDLVDAVPEMKKGTRFFIRRNASLLVEKDGTQEIFKDLDVSYADSNFLSVFTFPSALAFQNSNALAKINSIVIVESLALKLFGKSEVVGQRIGVKDPNFPLTFFNITEVIKDVPKSSHFRFDALLSLNTPLRGGQSLKDLNWNGFYSYMLADRNADPTAIQSKLDNFSGEYFKDEVNMGFGLQAMTDIHLKSDINFEAGKNNDIRTVNYLAMTAFLILLMAYFNYINFSTAKSTDRAKEIGVRKVLGAQKGELRLQFFVETAIINILSIVVAILLLFMLKQLFPSEQALFFYNNWQSIFSISGLYLVLILIAGIFLSGLYPAFVMSSFNPLKILSGSFKGLGKGIPVRNFLVSAQYTISIFLIIASLVIYNQVNYMLKQDKGIDINDVLIVNLPDIRDENYREKLGVYKNELEQMAFVTSISTASTTPGNGYNYSVQARTTQQLATETSTFYIDGVDENFLDHYKAELLSGRNFRGATEGEKSKVILNEAAVRQLGFNTNEEVIGKELLFDDSNFEVIGVIANYHHKSLKEAYDPQILAYYGTYVPHFSVRIPSNPSQQANYLAQLESSYKTVFGQPFDYFFLEQHFNTQYESDVNLLKLSGVFSFIAILIAVFGLIGMVAFTITRRLKEVAIRRVLGASAWGILMILSRKVLILNLISGVVAALLSITYLNQWLNDFAFKINLSLLHFLVPIILVLGITILIVLLQSSRVLSLSMSRFIKE